MRYRNIAVPDIEVGQSVQFWYMPESDDPFESPEGPFAARVLRVAFGNWNTLDLEVMYPSGDSEIVEGVAYLPRDSLSTIRHTLKAWTLTSSDFEALERQIKRDSRVPCACRGEAQQANSCADLISNARPTPDQRTYQAKG